MSGTGSDPAPTLSTVNCRIVERFLFALNGTRKLDPAKPQF